MKKFTMLVGAMAAAVSMTAAQPAAAYPIDCAILLCLAGGFPPSTECAAAKAKMIQRITPWPIEPPLQLWNCPLSIPADLAAAIGMSDAGLGADGLTDDVREYRDAVEIYHIRNYYIRKSGDDRETVDITQKGVYDENGDFHWVSSSYERGPEWLADAVGGKRIPITECVLNGRDGCRKYEIVRYENRASTGIFSRIRGVAIRTKDYEGNYTVEYVSY